MRLDPTPTPQTIFFNGLNIYKDIITINLYKLTLFLGGTELKTQDDTWKR